MTRGRVVLLGVLVFLIGVLITMLPSVFAKAIAFAEGYGVPGAIPTTRNNPGDLTEYHGDGSIKTFASIESGWAALMHFLGLIKNGASVYYRPDMTIAEMSRIYTATEQTAWASNVAAYLRAHGSPDATVDSSISRWL